MRPLALSVLFSGAICGVLHGHGQPLANSRTLSLRQDDDRGPQPLDLIHDGNGRYFIEISIGQSQTMRVQLRSDTYYSWVPASNSSTCNEGSCTYGNFNAGMSSTYANWTESTNFSTVSVPGTQGVWFTDNVNVGNLSTVNLTMGLAYDLVDPYGALGIMDWVSEAVQCVLQQLVDQGAAVTQAYSLSLGGPDAATGSILFGAIDTDKYEGDLMSLDYGITLTSVHARSSSGVDDLTVGLPIAVDIFVGRPALVLPAELAFNMWAIAGAEYWSEKDTATVPCSMKDSEGFFTFGLGGSAGPKVVVPMRNLVSTLSGFGDTCAFLVKNHTKPENYHLGVPLLQSVYAVFDKSNAKLALATPKIDSTTSNIVPFAGKAAHIPSTVSVPDQPRTVVTQSPTIFEMPTATKSFSAAAGFQSSTSEVLPAPTSLSTNPTGQSDDPPEAGLTKEATIGIGVGVGVGGFALGVLAVAFFLSRKRQKEQDLASDKFANTSSPPPSDFQAPVLQEYPAEMDAQPVAYELPPEEFPVEAKALLPLGYPANAGSIQEVHGCRI